MSHMRSVLLRSNNKMPALGLGTWQLSVNTAKVIGQALDMGYRMIDTSGDYGTQPAVGEAVKASHIPRTDIYIVTKVEEDDDAYSAARTNLTEMQQDYADLILIHRPPAYSAGTELWEGLIRAKKEGMTKDIGVSNYSIEQIEELVAETGVVPAVNQIEWSPFGHSDDMYDYARDNDIIIQAYSPLTRGDLLDSPVLENIAAAHHKTSAQVLLRWNIQLGVVPIVKANRTSHLSENLNVFDFELNLDEMLKLHSLNQAYSALGSLPYV